MAGRRVRFSARARRDLAAVTAYYNAQRSGLGLRVLDMIEKGLRAIDAFPASFPLKEPPYRFYKIERFPFSIAYDYFDSEIYVIALVDLRREPGYWNRGSEL